MRDEPAMCSWCWNSAGDAMDRYSTCTQDQASDFIDIPSSSKQISFKTAIPLTTKLLQCYIVTTNPQDPIALGPPKKNEDEQKVSGYSGLPMETDRGIPAHVGKEKQLHSATGYNIVIDSEGNVYGTREPYNQEAILQFNSRAAGEVQIKGKNSNMYLAMNDKGKVYAECDPESENTWFKEEYEVGWNYYIWLGNQKEWFVGIKKSGKMKHGHRTRRGQKAVKFVPRSAEPSYN